MILRHPVTRVVVVSSAEETSTCIYIYIYIYIYTHTHMKLFAIHTHTPESVCNTPRNKAVLSFEEESQRLLQKKTVAVCCSVLQSFAVCCSEQESQRLLQKNPVHIHIYVHTHTWNCLQYTHTHEIVCNTPRNKNSCHVVSSAKELSTYTHQHTHTHVTVFWTRSVTRGLVVSSAKAPYIYIYIYTHTREIVCNTPCNKSSFLLSSAFLLNNPKNDGMFPLHTFALFCEGALHIHWIQ